MKKRIMVLPAISIALVFLTSGFVVAFDNAPNSGKVSDIPEVYFSSHFHSDGYRAGTYFRYDATGTYNNTSIGGIYNLDAVALSGQIGCYRWLDSTIPELNDMMNDYGGDNPNYPNVGPFPKLDFVNVMADPGPIGVGNVSTAYGSKVVVQQFHAHEGWVVVYYVGFDPQVVYGCTAVGPNFHLDLRLNTTNDQFAIENNTSPIRLVPDGMRGAGYGFYADGQNSPQINLYSPDGAPMRYNLTATDVNMYAWSEADILSMINGGPYACNLTVTKLHLGSETGRVELPPGFFVIFLIGHQAEGTTASFYCCLEGVTAPPDDATDQPTEDWPTYDLGNVTVEAQENQTVTYEFSVFIEADGNMGAGIGISGAENIAPHISPTVTLTMDGNSYLMLDGGIDMAGVAMPIGEMKAGRHSGNLTVTFHESGICTVSANLWTYG